MRQVMVRYRIKADRAAENERYISRVFEQLDREQPSGLQYAAFKLDDGVSFVHLVSLEDGEGSNGLTELSAFKAFVAGIRDRCEEPPAATELKEIGAYPFQPSDSSYV